MIKFNKFVVAAVLAVFLIVPAQSMAAERVLFVLSAHHAGYSLGETLAVYEILQKNGIEADFASPQGAAGYPGDLKYLPEEAMQRYYSLLRESSISHPIALRDVVVAEYDAVYVPGGHGPSYDLPGHPELQRIFREFHKTSKIIAAVCHGPAALAGVKLENGKMLVDGKRVTGKSNAEEGAWSKANNPFMIETRFKAEGAEYSAAAPNQAHVVHDGLLLTGQNPASARPLATKLVELLQTK